MKMKIRDKKYTCVEEKKKRKRKERNLWMKKREYKDKGKIK